MMKAVWPINFLMEMMFFMFDTIIAGPSAGTSQDAKRNLEAAVPSGDIVSTARSTNSCSSPCRTLQERKE